MRSIVVFLGLTLFGSAVASPQDKKKPKNEPLKESEIATEYESKVLPILSKFCFKCHGPEKKKGDLARTGSNTTEQVLGRMELWQKAVERLNAFEMPPEKSPQPSFEEKGVINQWLGRLPKGKLDCNQLATRSEEHTSELQSRGLIS